MTLRMALRETESERDESRRLLCDSQQCRRSARLSARTAGSGRSRGAFAPGRSRAVQGNHPRPGRVHRAGQAGAEGPPLPADPSGLRPFPGCRNAGAAGAGRINPGAIVSAGHAPGGTPDSAPVWGDFRLRLTPAPLLQVTRLPGNAGPLAEAVLSEHGFAPCEIRLTDKVSGFFDG